MPTSTLILPTVTRHFTAPGFYADVLYSDARERIEFKPRTRSRIKRAANQRARRTVRVVLATASPDELNLDAL